MKTTKQLINIIDLKSQTASTDSFDISFGEIASMYPEELEIKPSYQRLFRWSETQQSQFIESLLLGLPIPPIFVIETEHRKYDLIDGLQRISSFLHFMGLLDNYKYSKGDKLVLQNCDIVPELNGFNYDELPLALKIQVKRSYIRMQIIKKESPSRLKYDMFKRLSTGGSLLSVQEIRNSTLRLLSEEFINFIQRLKGNPDFKDCISFVMENQIKEQYDDELVLRYFTLKVANLKKYKGTLADNMTTFAEEVADNKIVFDYKKEEEDFNKTFKILNEVMPNGEIFVGLNQSKLQKQFLAYNYEAFSLALSRYKDKINLSNKEQIKELSNQFAKLKEDIGFKKITKNENEKRTSGSKYFKYLNKRLQMVNKTIENTL